MQKQEIENLAILVRNNYNKESVTDIIMALGYELTNSGHFKIRQDEGTPSASVSKLGLINDFGGSGYDIIKLLTDVHGMQFVDALEWIAAQWNISYTDTVSPRPVQQQQQKEDPHKKQMVLKKVADTLSWYDSYQTELQTFKNYEYQSEALAIAPMWLYQQATKEALQHFKNVTTYDHKNKTIIVKIFDYNGVAISYKRRRYNDGKWITKAETSPNQQCYMSIKTQSAPVYIIEGHHDMLTSILMQGDQYEPFDFIMVPTENYKEFTDYELDMLRGRDVCFILDLKFLEDGSINQKAYYKLGMHQLAAQLRNHYGKEAMGVDLKDFLKTEGCQVDQLTSIDLSDAIFAWKSGLGAFIGALQFYVDGRR